ncbi:hypothetical protein DFJ73DRAFT_800685, partial [Zopfochytrium polystomum]
KSVYGWKDQLERRTGRHHVTCPWLPASVDERQHPQGPPLPPSRCLSLSGTLYLSQSNSRNETIPFGL